MKCVDEGILQAYLDSELSESEMSGVAGHLEVCGACRDRQAQHVATLAHVHACLETLGLDAPVVRAARTTAMRWSWAAAALVALLFVNAKRTADVPKPQALPARQTVAAIPPKAVKDRPQRPKPQEALDDFVALDNADPIQMGMVVRVMLPVSGPSSDDGVQEIAADLVIGEDGRPRAFRLVQ